MSDKTLRELLELAAKAAGMPLGYAPEEWEWCRHRRCLMNVPGGGHPPNFWDPADDDGDSRRLQVACKIDMEFYEDFVIAGKDSDHCSCVRFSECGGDQSAACRLAVLRAAATIGKAMP